MSAEQEWGGKVETNYVYRIRSKEGKGAGTKRGRPDERGELRGGNENGKGVVDEGRTSRRWPASNKGKELGRRFM
jgi:hypothetical protein